MLVQSRIVWYQFRELQVETFTNRFQCVVGDSRRNGDRLPHILAVTVFSNNDRSSNVLLLPSNALLPSPALFECRLLQSVTHHMEAIDKIKTSGAQVVYALV